eukprot:COSAG02_NODE_5366_length_4396_cov_69.993548_1_plen_232_part_00
MYALVRLAMLPGDRVTMHRHQGAECSWTWVLRRANFLSSFAGKGLFFLYIAIPLLSDGWQEYKGCVMLWQRSVPCPSTPSDDPAAGGDGGSGWKSALDGLLTRLLVHSMLVHFAVGVALFSAGVLQLVFAATGPPSLAQQPHLAQEALPGLDAVRPGSDDLTGPLLGKDDTTTAAGVSVDEADVEKAGARARSASPQLRNETAAGPEVGSGEGRSVVVQRTSWPPAWARSM